MKQNGALVGFSATRSMFASNVCDTCRATGFVTILTIPETEQKTDGTLRTVYRKLWLCDSCRDRLLEALRRARMVGGL